MATKEKSIKRFDIRRNRYFSDSFKRKIVHEIENNLTSVGLVTKEYGISRTSVYKWVYTYSLLYKKGFKQVVEPMSDSKKIAQLKAQIKELEQLLGRKQIEIEFKEKMIELAEEKYGVDIKKKYGSKQSDGSGSTENNTSGA